MPTSRLMRLQRDMRAPVERTTSVSSVHFLKLVEDQGDFGFWSREFAAEKGTCSVGVYRMFSVDASARIDHIDLMEMIHPDDLDILDGLESGLIDGRPMSVEYRIIRPDGHIKWIKDCAEVIFDREGKAVAAIGVLRDITETRELKLAVERGWARQQAITDLIGATSCGLDLSGRLLYRTGWTKLTGQKLAEAAGWGWLDVLRPERRDQARRAWLEAISNAQNFILDAEIRCADGTYRHHHIKAAPIFGKDKTVVEWAGVIIPYSATFDQSRHVAMNADQVLSGAKVRAARGILAWSRDDLATIASVSVSSIRRIESEGTALHASRTSRAILAAFHAHGITFSDTGKASSCHWSRLWSNATATVGMPGK